MSSTQVPGVVPDQEGQLLLSWVAFLVLVVVAGVLLSRPLASSWWWWRESCSLGHLFLLIFPISEPLGKEELLNVLAYFMKGRSFLTARIVVYFRKFKLQIVMF